jgi:NAD(P)-dependent dehydrogenase (short-subunit alcohol dehydrogenase family)
MLVVITGAASGLGQAFLNHFATEETTQILAIDQCLVVGHDGLDRISVLQGDITDAAFLSQISARLEDCPIDLLIHSAGIRGLVPSIERAQPNDVAAAETLEIMDTTTLERTFRINAIGTFLLLRTLLPNLRACAASAKASIRSSKVIIMSSRMGSIASNMTGGGYAYRASKAALNGMIKSFSIDVPEVKFLLVHPGRVETGLTACREEGAIEKEDSVQDMVRLIDGKWKTGSFVDRWGENIAW